MKYDLDGKTITIPDAELEKLETSLDITKDEAIELYLTDNGFIVDEAQAELTAKAKDAGAGLHATEGKSKRKPPVRKPDETKRELIEQLFLIVSNDFKAENVAVTNVERMIAFEFDGDKYELTLTKKRKPKE